MVSEPVKDSRCAVPPRMLCSTLVHPRKPKSCTHAPTVVMFGVNGGGHWQCHPGRSAPCSCTTRSQSAACTRMLQKGRCGGPGLGIP
eukprot:1161418-Pelagomonas_calceolata.AAC.8